MAEVRAYTNPPELVDLVMQAVMILRGGEPTWAEAKRQLADTSFINQLKEYDKDNMTDRILKKIGTYVSKPEFKPDTVGRVSFAAKSLCMWVRAMEVYGRIYRVVEPKKKRLESAMAQLAEKQASLAEARAKLQEVGGVWGGVGLVYCGTGIGCLQLFALLCACCIQTALVHCLESVCVFRLRRKFVF